MTDLNLLKQLKNLGVAYYKNSDFEVTFHEADASPQQINQLMDTAYDQIQKEVLSSFAEDERKEVEKRLNEKLMYHSS